MSNFKIQQDAISAARLDSQLAEDKLTLERGLLHQAEKDLKKLEERGRAVEGNPDGLEKITGRTNALLHVSTALQDLIDKRDATNKKIDTFNQQALDNQIQQLDVDIPMLLFPVRIETRFMTVADTQVHGISDYSIRASVQPVLTEMDQLIDYVKTANPQPPVTSAKIDAVRSEITLRTNSVRNKLILISEVNPKEKFELQERETILNRESAILENKLNNLKNVNSSTQIKTETAKGKVQSETKKVIESSGNIPINGPIEAPISISDLVKVILRQPTNHRELWVRIYPDTIAIDTHEKQLTADEINAGKNYWLEFWKAGTDQNLKVGAWRALVNQYGSQRAAWIVKQLTPTSSVRRQRPSSQQLASQDYLAVLSQQEINAGKTYWNSIWDSGNNSSKQEQAWNSLELAHPSPRAERIAEDTQPLNLNKKPQTEKLTGQARILEPDFGGIGKGNPSKGGGNFPGIEKPPTFPDLVPKAEGWSRPPYTKIMPDRFVVKLFKKDKTTGHLNYNSSSATTATEDYSLINYIEQYSVIGNSVPDVLQVGIDPNNIDAIGDDAAGNIQLEKEIKWLQDFEEAVRVGMGIKVPISDADAATGFDRVLVYGLKISANETESAKLTEELFQAHHYTSSGLSIIEQGTPTNNTENQSSGYSSTEDEASRTYELELGTDLFSPTQVKIEKTNGQWLADLLGLDYGVFQHVKNANLKEFKEAMAMNKALYPATLGTFFEDMLNKAFIPTNADIPYNDLAKLDNIRNFFTEHVVGRGILPALRVGIQPYGILPTTAYSLYDDTDTFLKGIAGIMNKMAIKWKDIAENKVKHVGFPISQTGDAAVLEAQQNFLDIAGLTPDSVSYYSHFATGVISGHAPHIPAKSKFLNFHNITSPPGEISTPDSRVFTSYIQYENSALLGALIDTLPSSETRKLQTIQGNKNYIHWMLESKLWNIRYNHVPATGQDKTQNILLYMMLRHALSINYWDAASRILVDADPSFTVDLRAEDENVNRYDGNAFSKWSVLFQKFQLANFAYPSPTGDVKLALHLKSIFNPNTDEYANTYFDTQLNQNTYAYKTQTAHLQEARKMMRILAEMPTAKLQRAFAEHLDLAAYRLDAWQTGLVNQRLQTRRNLSSTRQKGVYIGSYAWVENLRPSTPTTNNYGYIHAPSLNHAVTAAILRSGYVANSPDSTSTNTLAVNLTSERVRRATYYIEGINKSQPLGALLGYTFERGMHESLSGSLNQFILDLRKTFPLVSNSLTANNLQSTESIEAVEARNVVDGLALLLKYKEKMADPTFNMTTQYAQLGLPSNLTSRNGIIAEIEKIKEDMDALADLALAEGVFQLAQGNHERAGAVMKALGEGKTMPEPEIIKTSRTGKTFTQRVVLAMDVVTDVTVASANPWNLNLTPLSLAEPSLNKWAANLLGSPVDIKGEVHFGTNQVWSFDATDLRIQALDFLTLMAGNPLSTDSQLSQLIYYYTRKENNLAQDVPLEINYQPTGSTKNFKMLLSLAQNLNEMLTSSRSVTADDYVLPSLAVSGDNVKGYVLIGGNLEYYNRFAQSCSSAEQLKNNLNTLTSTSSADDVRNLLLQAQVFQLDNCVPISFVETDTDTQSILLEQASEASKALESRLAEIDVKNILNISSASNPNSTKSLSEKVNLISDGFKILFGRSFVSIPLIQFTNIDVLEVAYNNRQAILDSTQISPVESWLEGIGRVKKRMDIFDKVLTLACIYGTNEIDDLSPIQLPYLSGDYWLGAEFPSASTKVIEDEKLSVMMKIPASGLQFTMPHAGLLIDEWVEVIPNEDETTGIAFNYNAPNAEAPQSLLLAVSPKSTGTWTHSDLLAILNETFDMAKTRAVEPDHLNESFYAQLLPATLGVITYKDASVTLDYGFNNDAPMYLPTAEPPGGDPDGNDPTGGTGPIDLNPVDPLPDILGFSDPGTIKITDDLVPKTSVNTNPTN